MSENCPFCDKRQGVVAGTAAYMSPEQAESKPLDARSEVFSFGTVLHEMLSGTRPFGGDTAAQVVSAVLRDDPPPLAAPAPIERIVRRCLAKQVAQRFLSRHEVKVALEEMSGASDDPEPSIAVLPFEIMSGDKDCGGFSFKAFPANEGRGPAARRCCEKLLTIRCDAPVRHSGARQRRCDRPSEKRAVCARKCDE